MNMIGLLFSPLGRWAMVAVVLAALVGLNTCTAKDRNDWKEQAGFWKGRAVGWNAAYVVSEKRRKLEQRQAVAAISETQGACDARVAEARRSARVIRQIVERPVARDENNCPRRGIVTAADGLSDALRPPSR